MKLRLFFLTMICFLACNTGAFSREPLEGRWHPAGGDDVLILNGDGSFEWGEQSGRWFLDAQTLYLHTPGALIGYRYILDGRDLTLTGSALRSGELRFTYASRGRPVSPAQGTSVGDTLSVEPERRPVTTADSSLTSMYSSIRILSGFMGRWVSLEPVLNMDTLHFSLNSHYRKNSNRQGVFRTIGDRIYVLEDTTVTEYYYLHEEPFLIRGTHAGNSVEVYRRVNDPVLRVATSDMDRFAGVYITEGVPYASSENANSPLRMAGQITIDRYGRIEGIARVQSEDRVADWGGYISPIGNTFEIRLDNGAFIVVNAQLEITSGFGKILGLDGQLYREYSDEVRNIDTEERLHPYDAADLRRLLENTLERIYANYRE